jgi:hypothetical protein
LEQSLRLSPEVTARGRPDSARLSVSRCVCDYRGVVPYDDGTFYNEADTRAKLIDPAVKGAGWGDSQIEREHYFDKNRQITAAGST